MHLPNGLCLRSADTQQLPQAATSPLIGLVMYEVSAYLRVPQADCTPIDDLSGGYEVKSRTSGGVVAGNPSCSPP